MDVLFTSESISLGHPDRLCDTIANAVITDLLKADRRAHAGIECLVTKNFLAMSGEVTSTHTPDYEKIARRVAKEIGYDRDSLGFNADNFTFLNKINTQSPDIAQGVNRGEDEIGAGDQGIIFGYATNETEGYYPLAATLANEMTTLYQDLIKGDKNFRPDAKSQVTVNYTKGTIDTVVFAASHNPEVTQEYVSETIKSLVIIPVLRKYCHAEAYKDTRFLINTTGRFVVCGPNGDAGVVGRKLTVDSYGGYGHIGGGCTNGKDPSKVDASAARAARHAAKNLVAAGFASELEIQLSYSIGVANPVSINVNTFGTGVIADEKIAEILFNEYDFSPAAIIKNLHLDETNYELLTYTGQFCGKYAEKDNMFEFPWENLNLVEKFKSILESCTSAKSESKHKKA